MILMLPKVMTWRILLFYFNPIKKSSLICIKENRLVNVEYSKSILYFSKYFIF